MLKSPRWQPGLKNGRPIREKNKLYPNPSNGVFTIHSSYDIQSVTLLNAVGQVEKVTSKNIVKDFKGLVIIEVVTAEGLSTKKIVIE